MFSQQSYRLDITDKQDNVENSRKETGTTHGERIARFPGRIWGGKTMLGSPS